MIKIIYLVVVAVEHTERLANQNSSIFIFGILKKYTSD